MKVYELTFLIVFLTSCQHKETIKEDKNQSPKTIVRGLELNPKLVTDFYKVSDSTKLNYLVTSEFKVDLDSNGKPDVIILRKIQDKGDDPGDFHQITIELDDGSSWVASNFDGWVRFDNNYTVPDPVKKINQLDTDLILLTNFANTKIIGLFGWVYASEPGLLTIIEFSSGQPRLMINKQFDLVSLDSAKIMTKYFNDKCWTELMNNKLITTCE